MSVDVVVERDLAVPMRDGVVLRADVHRPAEGAAPVLLLRTPYDKDIPLATLVGLPPMTAVTAGFAVVVQDVRGRGASDGVHQPFAESDDGYDSVEWAAAQPWSDGRVAMFGSSYHGAAQLQAALAGPPALRAICPIQASSDYFEGRTYFGGALELGSLITTTYGTMGPVALRASGHGRDEARALRAEMVDVLEDLPGRFARFPYSDWLDQPDGPVRQLSPWVLDWIAHDTDDDYWQAISVERRHASLDVPALHITSWFDMFHVGTLRNYEGLRAGAATPTTREAQHLIVGPWNHYPARSGGYGASRLGDVTFGLGAQLNLDAIQLGWFREHLLGEEDAFRQKGRVRLFVMGANEWRDEVEWPLARAEERSLFLSGSAGGGDGTLAATPIDAPPDRFTFDPLDPVPTHGGAHLVLGSHHLQGPVDQRDIEVRPDVLTYTSEELADDLEVIGWVDAEIWVSSTAPCTDVTARLSDVHPDGRSISVCDGIRRVRLTPGEAAPVRISLGATAQRFGRGHRLRLAVSSSNSPRFDVNPNTGRRAFDEAAPVVAHQQVFHDRERPSRLVLPVIPITAPR